MDPIPDIVDEISSFLPNSDIYNMLQSNKEVSSIASRYLRPTQEDFKRAILNNDELSVEMLLQREEIDPSADDNWAICQASEKGYANVVEILLADPRVDPSVENNFAIRYASRNREVARLLLQHPRISSTYGT